MDNRIEFPPEMDRQLKVFNNFDGIYQHYKAIGKIGEDGKKGVHIKKVRELKGLSLTLGVYTHPVGFGRPAILHAPFAGPDGKSWYIFFKSKPVCFTSILIGGAISYLR